MEFLASHPNKKPGDTNAPAGDNDAVSARRARGWQGWRAWIIARPILLVSSAVYLATLVTVMRGDCPQCDVPWKNAVLVGMLLLLLLLDRLEYPLFGETPSRPVGAALLATRLALTMAVFIIMDPWQNGAGLFMLALIPYMGYLYFGSRGGIAAGVGVWLIGAATMLVAALPHLTRITTYKAGTTSTDYIFGWSLIQGYITGLTGLLILIVFVVVSARITALERIHTGRTKRLLAQLETSHARLEIHSQRAIALTEENKRTASEIHDGLAHYLTAVSVQIEMALAYRDISPGKAERAIRSAKEAISKSLQDVRRSVAILRAPREVAPESLHEQDSESELDDSLASSSRGWLSWLFPRLFDVIATTLYLGIFVMGLFEEDTMISGNVFAFAGVTAALIILDRVEFALFRERPTWWAGGLLVIARIAIMYELFTAVQIWYSLMLLAIIPYWFTLYFGSRVGYISVALLVIGVAFCLWACLWIKFFRGRSMKRLVSI